MHKSGLKPMGPLARLKNGAIFGYKLQTVGKTVFPVPLMTSLWC